MIGISIHARFIQRSAIDQRIHMPRHRNQPVTKTFGEFFAGIGLVREGLSASAWECIYANDIDAKKREMYALRFGALQHFHLGDVWDKNQVIARIPIRPFLATASFPCIDLSLAGHWRGFKGEHSSAFFGFAQALAALGDWRPPLVMLENVAGFITSHDGRDFEAVIRSLAELGYFTDAFMLDAKFFVPQSRPRVFVIGLDETLRTGPFIRRSRRDSIADDWTQRVANAPKTLRPPRLIRLMRSIQIPTGWIAFDLKEPASQSRVVGDFIDLDDAQEWWAADAVQKHYDMMSDRHRRVVDQHLASGKDFVGTIFRRKRQGKTRSEVRFDGLAGCLRTPRGGSARQIVIAVQRGRLRMRWMSAREYARLQGADDFPLTGNTIQNLYGFGDAVCVPVIRWIDQQVLTPVFEAAARRTAQAGLIGITRAAAPG